MHKFQPFVDLLKRTVIRATYRCWIRKIIKWFKFIHFYIATGRLGHTVLHSFRATLQVAPSSQSIDGSVSGESSFTSMNGNTVVVRRDPDDGAFSVDGMSLTRCPDKCSMEADPGPCEAIIPR